MRAQNADFFPKRLVNKCLSFAIDRNGRLLSSTSLPLTQSLSQPAASRLELLRQTLKEEKLEQTALASLESTNLGENWTQSSDLVSGAKRLRNKNKLPKPRWLKVPDVSGQRLENYNSLKRTVGSLGLATVCEEARCPNIAECWGGGKSGVATATIMIMGDTCTRACRFCAIKTSRAPPPLDPEEPQKVAEAVSTWGLNYVVLTSVDRDDLEDQGAKHFSETVRFLKLYSAQKSLDAAQAPRDKKKDILVECLTPDFRGEPELVKMVANSGLDVFAHNIETVERLTPTVRDRRAGYRQSLNVLKLAKESKPTLITKTSVMLGLGETDAEVEQAMRDCRDNGVDVITFGQYLRPTKGHLRVLEYLPPEKFDSYGNLARSLGFRYVASGPLVRSSYKAGELFMENMIRTESSATG